MAEYYVDQNGKITKKKKKEETTTKYHVDESGKITVLQPKSIASDENIAPVKEKKDEKRTWFQKSELFDDGYDLFDGVRTVGASMKDLTENVSAGILGIGEKAVDFGATLVGGTAKLFGADKFADKVDDFVAKDLYDEHEIAKKLNILSPVNSTADIVRGLIGLEPLFDSENDSVFGDKSDALAYSGGQLAGTAALQAVGVPWFVTTGVTSFGSEAEAQFREGAGYLEAITRSSIAAALDIATEKLTGGSGLGEKGLINLSKLTTGITNKAFKLFADYGLDLTFEGVEESLAAFGNRLTSALFEEKNLKELLFSEEAFDEYLESFIGGFVLSGGMNAGKVMHSVKSGRDYQTGLTENEQAVVDKEIENRIAEKEAGGTKLTNKQKQEIEANVLHALEKGYISTDVIEEVFGGDTYKAYKDEVEKNDALRDEYKALGALTSPTLAQTTRYNELNEQRKNNDFMSDNRRNGLKTRLGQEVFAISQGTMLEESYRERARAKQKLDIDVTQYKNKYARKTAENFLNSELANNTNRTHELLETAVKISEDTGHVFYLTDNAKMRADGTAYIATRSFKTNGNTVEFDLGTGRIDTAFETVVKVGGKAVSNYKIEGNKLVFETAPTEGDISVKYSLLSDGYRDANGDITINVDSPRVWQFIVGHEVTHNLEGTDEYDDLAAAIKEFEEIKGTYKSGRSDAEGKYNEGTDIDAELNANVVGEYLFGDEDFVKHLSTKHNSTFGKIYRYIEHLLNLVTAGSKEARQLEEVKWRFEAAYRAQKNTANDSGVQQSISEIVDENNNSYGMGVKLDSTLLDNLSPEERVEMVKERVKELGGEVFTAYDQSGNAVDVTIAESSRKFKNKSGKKVPVNKDMTAYLANPVKQEAIVLVDELITASSFKGTETATHPHDWVDNNGKNDWDVWETYIQDKEKNVWKAKLRIANSTNGEKILYDVFPIEKVGGVKTLDTAPTNYSISQNSENVNREFSLGGVDGVKYSLSANAKTELHKALYDTNYRNEVRLRDVTPEIMLSQKDVRNLPMTMKASHIRENVFAEDEAKKLGLKVDEHTHYHGLGEDFFLQIIDSLDNVTEAYRGTKNAEKTERRENYFLLVSEFKDKDGSTINVPVYIDELANYNRVMVDVNKISTTFGRDGFRDYINKQIRLKNLVRIKNKSTQTSERYATVAQGYGMDAPKSSIPQSAENVNSKFSLSENSTDIAPTVGYATPMSEIRYQAPADANIAPVREDMRTNEGTTATIDTAPLTFPGYETYRTVMDGDIGPAEQAEEKSVEKSAGETKTARVLTESQSKEHKKRGLWSFIKEYVLDNGMVFEEVAKKTNNRELEAKWNSIRNAGKMAQFFIGRGKNGIRAVNDIRAEVEKRGLQEPLFNYLYHMHNIDRMSLEERGFGANKAVFGDNITADISRAEAKRLLAENPTLRSYAEEIYANNRYLRQLMVDEGLITQEVADLWEEMYPHYVPIGRSGATGMNVNVPLDTRRTGINSPVKRAKGGNGDIDNLFDTLGTRAMQTYRAIAKNRFGVELKNTLGTVFDANEASIDDAMAMLDQTDSLLKQGENGMNPTFTVFEGGERVTYEITEEMYDALKPTGDILSYTIKPFNAASNIFRALLTEYNPVFTLTNAIKDAQDVLVNSQHAAKTYATIPRALVQMATGGKYYTEYLAGGGEQNTYFDNESSTYKKENKVLEIAKTALGLNAISKANQIIEMAPRLAEYIASREAGRSIDVSMLDAARVTTNFAAGGKLTKFLDRNGATFLSASVNGAVQQARNLVEAKQNGVKGVMGLAAKFLVAGLPAELLNDLIWGDDEEYEELSDYVKQNYYIVGKYGDGKFVRIPKGRMAAVIQNAFEQMEHLVTGDDEADLRTFLELAVSNLAPNNPLENNIFAPIKQVMDNKTWYGDDLVPQRLQDLPAAEQYDESTDSLSRWIGETFNVSPYKVNYLLDQYSGGVGDVVLPMLTPEAESGDDSIAGQLLAPLRSKFTTDSVMNNQNVSDFYDTKDELTVTAKGRNATDEEMLSSKYMNSLNSEISNLYGEKREIQASDLPDSEKYEQVRAIQSRIVALTKEALDAYDDISYDGDYANIGDRYYKRDDDGEWQKLSDDQVTKYKLTSTAGDAPYTTDGNVHYRYYVKEGESEGTWQKLDDKELEKQKKVTKGLGIAPEEYWGKKAEYDYAYENPEKYAVAKSVGGYEAYKGYSGDLYDIKADKDASGKSISGSRKNKVVDYINNLDLDYGMKLILFKNEYNADDSYDDEIVEYLIGRDDISYEDKVTIFKELGFTVSADGTVSW